MRHRSFLATAAIASAALAAENCSEAAIAAIIGQDARVNFAYPIPENGTFQIPPSDSTFPGSIPIPTASELQVRSICAVSVEVRTLPNATYNFGLFLPQAWNQRFMASGNGGLMGGIGWRAMADNVDYGFAAMATDTGHAGNSTPADWAYKQPERVENWGWRAMHGSVELAKKIAEAYYGEKLAYSYYSGCSTGGRQGLKEAQMFPDDFDGIIAGAPAWWTTHLQTWTFQTAFANLPVDAPHHIPTELFPVVAAEVLKQCDPQDGLTDTVVSDPRGCNFRPETLLCTGGSNASQCLTGPQLDTLIKLHGDWLDSNQTFLFPRFELGSENQWSQLILHGSEPDQSLAQDYVKYLMDEGPDWKWQDWNPDYYVQLADKLDPGNATADDFDMSPFFKKGGKLIHYHGLSDGAIPPGSSVYFREHVDRAMAPQGANLDDFYKFYLVPGMQHCGGTAPTVNAPTWFAGAQSLSQMGGAPPGGPPGGGLPGGNTPDGPPFDSEPPPLDKYTVDGLPIGGLLSHAPGQLRKRDTAVPPAFSDAKHDMYRAIMDWVEKGTAPNEFIGTAFKNGDPAQGVARQRPLCPYPQQAKYSGNGDPNLAESWTCKSLY